MRILLVEDDQAFVEVLRTALVEQNHVVDSATDGTEGWNLAEAIAYDLILLDVVLPGVDGIRFCQRLRACKNQVLVMLLTARDTTTDKLLGLDSGADDYLVKPFPIQELIARIRALSRRGSTTTLPTLVCGDLCLDTKTRSVTHRGKLVPLSRKEYLLLELFLRHQTRVFSRAEILDQLWSLDAEPPSEDTIKSHIKSVRRKLKTVGAADWLETLYGQGYRINPVYLAQPTPQSEPPLTPQQQIDRTTAKLWQRTQALTLARIAFLEQAVQVLQQTGWDASLHPQAAATAHKLAGSLGMFGYDQGTAAARQLEKLLYAKLQPHQPVSPGMVQRAIVLISALRQALNSPPSLLVPELFADPIASSQRPSQILVIDDDPQVRLMLQVALAHQTLTYLTDTSRFWQTLDAVQPDLLILDINLPGISGLELAHHVRQHPQWGWLPIMFLTACTEPELLQQAFTIGADDYLTKPIEPATLAMRVSNRIRRIQQLRCLT